MRPCARRPLSSAGSVCFAPLPNPGCLHILLRAPNWGGFSAERVAPALTLQLGEWAVLEALGNSQANRQSVHRLNARPPQNHPYTVSGAVLRPAANHAQHGVERAECGARKNPTVTPSADVVGRGRVRRLQVVRSRPGRGPRRHAAALATAPVTVPAAAGGAAAGPAAAADRRDAVGAAAAVSGTRLDFKVA